MGEPFISIKIDHLTNYKEEPLKYYDLQALNDLDLKEIINLGAVDGYSRWVSNDGSVKWRLCLIKGYDAENQMFCIQWKHNNKEKKVTRLNLMLKSENEAMFDTRRDLAKYNRYRLLYLESYKKSKNN